MYKIARFAKAQSMIPHTVVYIVDDDPGVLASLEALLVTQDFDVRSFVSAQELFSKITSADVGCIITDLQMPDMDGMALQEKLKELGSHLSLIMVTGYASVSVTVEVMKKGAISLLEKPYDASQLLKEVKEAIADSKSSFERAERISNAISKIRLLTSEELRIMEIAVKGLPNKAISHELRISSRTIDRRRQAALQKTQVGSIAEFAVLLATARESGQRV